ncbi:phage tail assembly protein [Desulfovibrio mangrovi]|uniref:phage tail assembly protein n=1 Tax=Desulfovibrio mangrovi TaxID=2976983 RepID=UPI0022474976|nr:phage tail assembly protein [Desulfovibrio mangrovi]UZP67654.1 phage tail assembly protein [Desulfovibrio mangrovi]
MEVRTKVIILGSPLVVKEKEVLELTMREPLVEDMLDAAELAGDMSTAARLEVCTLGHLCDVPLADLMHMRHADYTKLQEAYRFLARSAPHEEETCEKQCLSSESAPDGGGKK